MKQLAATLVILIAAAGCSATSGGPPPDWAPMIDVISAGDPAPFDGVIMPVPDYDRVLDELIELRKLKEPHQ